MARTAVTASSKRFSILNRDPLNPFDIFVPKMETLKIAALALCLRTLGLSHLIPKLAKYTGLRLSIFLLWFCKMCHTHRVSWTCDFLCLADLKTDSWLQPSIQKEEWDLSSVYKNCIAKVVSEWKIVGNKESLLQSLNASWMDPAGHVDNGNQPRRIH